PAWFPELSAMSDRFTPIHRIRLDHNTVAGADEMVVYETPWTRSHGRPERCGVQVTHYPGAGAEVVARGPRYNPSHGAGPRERVDGRAPDGGAPASRCPVARSASCRRGEMP